MVRRVCCAPALSVEDDGGGNGRHKDRDLVEALRNLQAVIEVCGIVHLVLLHELCHMSAQLIGLSVGIQ